MVKIYEKQRGEKKKASYKPFSAKIMMFGIVTLMLISLISAFEFDNVQKEEGIGKAGYPNIEIENAFGLGDTLWKGELTENTNVCGSGCEAITEINLTKDGSLIDGIKFEKVIGKTRIEKPDMDYQILIKTNEEEVNISDYETQCNNIGKYGNGSDNIYCSNVVVGSHLETEKTWEEYILGTELPKGTYEIKLTGSKMSYETYDWIYDVQGETLNSWAIWGAGGVALYYDMNTTSDLVAGVYNMEILAGTPNVGNPGGILASMGSYLNANNYYIQDTPQAIDFNDGDHTYNMWILLDDITDRCFLSQYTGTSSHRSRACMMANGTSLLYYFDGAGTLYANAPAISTFFMMTVKRNATHNSLFINGSLVDSDTYSTSDTSGSDLCLGTKCNPASGDDADGDIDELGIWNISLSDAEISQLWNSGSAWAFGEVLPENPTVATLVSPADNNLSNVQSNTFNCSAIGDTLINISLYHNASGSWERNQTTTLTGSFNASTFQATLPEDYTLWTCSAGNSSGAETFATTNRTLFVDSIFPEVDIILPVNNSNSSVTTLSINYTIIDLGGYDSCWYSNDTYAVNLSMGCEVNITNVTWSDAKHNVTIWVNDSLNQINSSGVSFIIDTTSPVVNITYPINASTINSNDFDINYTRSDALIGLDSCWYSNDTMTINTTLAGCINITTVTWSEGEHNVTIWVNDSLNNLGLATVNFSVDSTLPSIIYNVGNGTQASGSLLINHTINFTATDTNLDTCIMNYNSVNKTIPCTSGGVATHNFTMLVNGYNATVYLNDTFGNFRNSAVTWTFTALEANSLYNTTSYETKSETFKQNITTTGTLTSPKFIINGVQKTATSTLTGTNYELISTFDVPLSEGSKGFFFNYTIDGVELSSTNHSQNVSTTSLDICNSSLLTIFKNFTFADETNLSKLYTGTIPLISWTYYIGSGSVSKSFTFTNNTGNAEYDFCATPNQTLITNYTLQYSESNGNYPQRIIEISATLTNVTTERILYLLRSGEGQAKDVTFQVTNNAEQPLQNIHVVVNRTISGTPTTIGEGNTDASGGVTFFLNGDFQHTVVFTGTGYETFTSTLFPTQSGYTIILGGNATSNFTSFLQGISFLIAPTNATLLNDTIYDFNFALNSTYWDVTSFGFVLLNSTGDSIGTKTLNANGGNATLDLNTSSEILITMNYFWVANGNYTNGTRSWYIVSGVGTDFSIIKFKDDLEIYIDSGLFGLSNDPDNSFGLSIILFFFIFILTGIVSYKYGLVSPLAIASLVFSIVLFLDVGLGLMPNPTGAVPHFVTIVLAFVLIVTFLSEVRRI